MEKNTEAKATEVKKGQEAPSFETYKAVVEYLFEVRLFPFTRNIIVFDGLFFSMDEIRL